MRVAHRTLAGPALAVLLVSCGAPPPDTLGERDGSLAPCPSTPNCVHTGLRRPDGLAPMYLVEDRPRAESWARVTATVEAMPRVTVVTATDRYLHAEARTRLFRFVDDLELLLVEDGELMVRSASRLGRGDLGVNGRRVARLRAALAEAGVLR